MHKYIQSRTFYFVLAFCIFSMYLFGAIWPDIFWSTHFLAFIPALGKYSFLIITSLIILYAYKSEDRKLNLRFSLNNKSILILSIIAALIFYYLNIANDYYGDAKNFNPFLDQKLLEIKDGLWKELFSIQFKTGHARWGVFNLYSLVSYVLKTDMYQTFKIMDALFGAGYVYVWLHAINRYSKNTNTNFILALIGCFSPVLLIFCGHLETYGFVLFLLMAWGYLFVRAFNEKNKFLLWLLIPLFIICVRFNTPSIVLLPALILLFIHFYFKDNPKVNVLFELKNLFKYILIPLFILGLISYFFILGDYNDSRILNNETKDIDRLFLPLLSPEVPLDTYNLLSWNHISDFFMSFYFWSPGLLFLIGIIIINIKKINWNNTLLLLILLTILLFLGFLFMINPLMSLPMDWDLYILPIPFVLIFLLLIFQNHSEIVFNKSIILYIVGLQLLIVPSFIVLMNKTMHSYRVESVGVRVHNTYYQHADSYLLYALQLLDGKELYSIRKNNLIDKLSPTINGKIDSNYAALLLDEGINLYADKDYIKSRDFLLLAESHNPNFNLTKKYLELVNTELLRVPLIISKKHLDKANNLVSEGIFYLRQKKFYNKALNNFNRAFFYNPTDLNIVLLQMEAYFSKKDFKRALIKAEILAEQKYPNQKQAFRFVIHCSLEVEDYKKAQDFSKNYLNIWPEDLLIKSIYDSLNNNNNINELKYKFAKNE